MEDFIIQTLSTQEEKIRKEERKRIVEEIQTYDKEQRGGTGRTSIEEVIELINKIN